MRIVIVGVGDTGGELAHGLSGGNDIELVLIDQDEKRCDELADDLDALVLHGDGTHPDLLKEARLSEADALVACTGSDAVNTVVAMLARRFEVGRIIVRLQERGLRSACEEIGVAGIIAPRLLAASEMRRILQGGQHIDLSVLQRSEIRVRELEADAVAGQELGSLELPDGVAVMAVIRGDDAVFPRKKVSLEGGDSLLVLAENGDALQSVRGVLQLPEEEGEGTAGGGKRLDDSGQAGNQGAKKEEKRR